MDLKSTLHLPDAEATIPMKANLATLEPSIQAKWSTDSIYHRLQDLRKDAPSFVLHDGPPYTNSPIHIGTAMNKILKDIVIKSRAMMGFRTPYVPGFDNHGLPIEQAVMKKFAEKKLSPTISELREACRLHAAEYLDIQRRQFMRLGVFGLWEKPYTTMDFRFESEIVRIFGRMVSGGYIYKGLRPTLWSPTSQTALADTEIVYHQHVSKAIYVRFPLQSDPQKLFTGLSNVFTVIWTTTPWTIPANLACAFHPDFSYAIVKVGEDHYVILEALVEKVARECGWVEHRIIRELSGVSLENVSWKHPIFERGSVTVMADYVTTEDGTGVVHTAPSHGRDDFYTGQKYGLPIPNTVDERGVLTQEAGEFAGTFYKNCDTVVVDRLREVGNLLDVTDYTHSYPYAERDEKPVIFRATEQWYVGLDHNGLRANLLDSIAEVKWVPASSQTRIESMIKNRPDWCISRQRPWGVGIPIFYGATSRVPVLDPVAIEAVARLVEEQGSDAWFTANAEDILPNGYTHPETGETEFSKETDVLDVWFDSGATSMVVLEGNTYSEWKEERPADIYLEGSDQHRGWFNSSLILSQACTNKAPYKAVVTHGFVTDGQGLKMSKRLGNVIDPVVASDKYGADVLRYWVAGTDYANDVPCSDAILNQFGDSYRNVRNALRFLIGNVKGLPQDTGSISLLPLDQWIIEQAELLVVGCAEAYEAYDFGAVMTNVHNFCRQQLSGFYSDAIKDRMYCDGTDWDSRRSGQFACMTVSKALIQLVAPVLCHTAEEAWHKLHLTLGVPSDSVHFTTWSAPSQDRRSEIAESEIQSQIGEILVVRSLISSTFESWKELAGVKNSQEVIAQLVLTATSKQLLLAFEPAVLANFFRVSWVEINDGLENAVSFERSSYLECARSRVRRPDVSEVEFQGEKILLARRDRLALKLA